jgi:uncharacterized RDD family membrane protein YckC
MPAPSPAITGGPAIPADPSARSGSAGTLDTVVTAETPEGILLELRPAGLIVRSYALLLDWAIRLVAMYAVVLVVAALGEFGMGFAILIFFLLEWLYPVVFELTRSGATPGKRAFHIKVVMSDGLPVTPAAALTRNLLRVADFLPFAYGFAIVSMLARSDTRRLGDLAAGTLVVYETVPVARPSLEGVPPLAPALPLAAQDQAAVIALAVRAPTLTASRLDELAALASPVSGDNGRRGPEVTKRVLGVAQWLLGHRL